MWNTCKCLRQMLNGEGRLQIDMTQNVYSHWKRKRKKRRKSQLFSSDGKII